MIKHQSNITYVKRKSFLGSMDKLKEEKDIKMLIVLSMIVNWNAC